ncbi:barstar family protein [Streptomyces anthocyanicus]|uniref:barstar family protein n=1 Tax=Streptomyces anthocyanicus TaxID=68174 RepID=UPI0016710557|nr:barstar family protein [Streptomyces anthocyanicus]
MVTINVSRVADEGALHLLLKQELGFPDFYGMNWDAFRDAITGLVEVPDRLRFVGWDQLSERVPRGAIMLRQALHDYQAPYRPQLVVEYT